MQRPTNALARLSSGDRGKENRFFSVGPTIPFVSKGAGEDVHLTPKH